jgi:hypothetical protein
VVFDGEPVLAPIAGTRLSYAVNTNWDVFFDDSAKAWYLRSGGGWLVAPKALGPWGPAGVLPPDFAALPNDDNFRDVKADIPGRRFSAADAPIVYVSTVPAEIIVTSGPPVFSRSRGRRCNTSRTAMRRFSAAVPTGTFTTLFPAAGSARPA